MPDLARAESCAFHAGRWRSCATEEIEKQEGFVEAHRAINWWDLAVRGALPGVGCLAVGPVGRTLATVWSGDAGAREAPDSCMRRHSRA